MRRRITIVLMALCFLNGTTLLKAQKYDPGSGNTVLLIGQTYQEEYKGYINGTGLTPAGGSHYATFYSGTIEQGDDKPDAKFLDYIRSTQKDPYALVALSIKDNTKAGGYGQMINPAWGEFNSNAIWEACVDIRDGKWDSKIDQFAQTFASRPDVKFYLRVGYEVSLFLFAYKGEENANTWLEEKANAGINVFENPDTVAELDRQAYIDAYNHIAKRIKDQASNVAFVYHPVRGFNDTKWLYPGDQYVDFVGFSIFNNDICMEVNGTFNCEGEVVDPNLQLSMDFAKEKGKPLMIAESAAQYPATNSPSEFNTYLSRLDNVIKKNDIRVLAYINSDWQAHDWDDNWGDSRVEINQTVKDYWLKTYGKGTRYLHSGSNIQPPTCSDGIQNGDEEGVDCGGSCPNPCSTEPTCDDGIQNGDETGVDCGGSCPNSCGTGGSCGEFGVSYVDDNTIRVYHKDKGWSASWQYVCFDGYCIAGDKKDGYYYKDFNATLGNQYKIQFKAQDNASGQYLSPEKTITFTKEKCSFTGGTEPTCNDGIQNGDETGIDCGGSCPPCTVEPTCNDGIQNGDETGVDCGGSCPNSCGTGGSCGEFGVSYVNDNTIKVYHKDNGWTASWQYICLNGNCVPGDKKDGYYYKDFNATLGNQYKILFKAQDNTSGQYLSPEETVTFTTDECSFVRGTKSTKNVSGTTSVQNKNPEILVYPNPAKNKLNITGLDKNEHYTIYNFAGKAIFTDKSKVLDIKDLSSGMYLLRTGSNKTIRFIKE